MTRPRLGCLVAALAALLLLLAPVRALDLPPLSGRVVDQANLLDGSTRAALTSKLAALERQSTDQLVVVTLASLQGVSIEEFGLQLGRHWRIGQKDKNNGALLIVAANERKVRIEVGYGLEATLTDALTKFIIQKSILPRFKANDYPGGIVRGVDDIIQALTGDTAEWQSRAAPAQPNSLADFAQSVGGFLLLLLFAAMFGFFFFVIIALVLHLLVRFAVAIGLLPPRKKRQGVWRYLDYVDGETRTSADGSTHSSAWSSSSSSDSFSGGGGDFGGGGSSGDW